MSDFSDIISRLRERAGYPTARKFFMSVGGRAALKCTYAQYLNIESGRASPNPKVAQALVTLLRIWADPDKARRFCRAYLTSQYGPGEFVDFLTRSLGQTPSVPGSSPLRKAMVANVEARSLPMSAEQMQLIRSSPAHYWTFHVIDSDSGYWTPEKVAQTLKLPIKVVRRTMTELAAKGLVTEARSGSFITPYRGKYITHPPTKTHEDFAIPPALPQLQKLWGHMGDRHGKMLFHQGLFFRASEAELRASFPFLAQSVHGLTMYETNDKGPDTSFVVAEASIRRLLPF